jgi:hypothetical protein
MSAAFSLGAETATPKEAVRITSRKSFLTSLCFADFNMSFLLGKGGREADATFEGVCQHDGGLTGEGHARWSRNIWLAGSVGVQFR